MDQPAAAFKLTLPDFQGGRDALGLWQTSNQLTEPHPLSVKTEEIGSVWRAELPEDPFEATRLLRFQQYQIQQTYQAIPAASRRLPVELEAFHNQDKHASFSTQTPVPVTGPTTPGGILQLASQYHWGEDTSSYFLDRFKLSAGQLEEVAQSVAQFSDQVRRTVQQLALVETTSGGTTIGVTRVSWLGDTDTGWAARTGPERFNLHTQVLSQALATRQEWLHFLLIVTSGAARVATALATGPFSPIAIWTAWNYALQVIAEFRRLPIHANPVPGP